MPATVNSRRRSVSRGPDDQAQGVVMEGWMGGKRRRCMFKRKTHAFWVTFINRFSPSFGRILALHDAPDFGESGTAGKPIDTRFLRKPDFTLTVSGMDFSLLPHSFCSAWDAHTVHVSLSIRTSSGLKVLDLSAGQSWPCRLTFLLTDRWLQMCSSKNKRKLD